MADFMPGGLGGLAQGLRLAGGVMSPRVFEAEAQAEAQRERQMQAQRLMEIQQTVRGIEGGAIPAEAGQIRLKQLGFEAPVGPGPEAIKRTEMAQQRIAMQEAMSKLPQGATFEDRLIAMAPHMPPEMQLKAFESVERKREEMGAREKALQMQHEIRLQGLTNQQARDAEAKRHNGALEILRGEQINMQRLARSLGGSSGGGRGKAPDGFRWTDAGDLEFIPGGPRDPDHRPAKALPISAAQKLMENQQNLRRAEQALSLIKGEDGGDTSATGVKGYLPEAILQRTDKSGVQTRAAIADLGSLVIHDRSGAAVTAAEFPRLRPFIPLVTDSPEAARKKLERFVQVYRDSVGETVDFYQESGYNVPTGALRSGAAGGASAGPARVNSDADYNALPSGTTFVGPDGKTRRKP